MATVTRSTTWSDGQTLTAAALNAEFNNLLNALALTNADISAGAAIAYSKLNLTGAIASSDLAGSIAASKIANTAVTLTDTQTVTNKTFTKPTINGSAQGVSAVSGTTPTLDLAAANIFTITLSGSTTYSISNASTGQVFMVEVKQGTGSSHTNTWFAGITWVTSGATAPTQTTVSDGYTTYGFRCTGSNTYLGYLVGTN